MESKDKYVFTSNELSSVCFTIFQEMKTKGECCDVTLKFGDRAILAHRVVVSAAIPYFRNRFSNGETDTVSTDIPMPDVEPCVLECLVEFAYTHRIEITSDNALSLLSAACALDVKQVVNACSDFLIQQLSAQNAWTIREHANSLDCSRLKENVDKYICQNFDDVVATTSFINAPFTYINQLTTKDDLQTVSEEKVFEFIMKWVKKDPSERKHYLPEVLRNVRMKLLSPRYLVQHVATEELIKSSIPCRDIVDEARNHHVLSEGNKNLTHSGRRSENVTTKRSVTNGELLPGMYLVREESTLCLQRFEPERDSWITIETAPYAMSAGTATETNGKLCYVDQGHIRVYDPITKSWLLLADVYPIPRYFAAVAILDKKLYICGGRDSQSSLSTVDCLEVENKFTKSTIACTNMLKCRNYLCVVALGRNIFALGGQAGNVVHDSVERYSPSENVWIMVSPMLTKRFSFGCTTANGKIYAYGGVETLPYRNNLRSGELYDPAVDQWKHISAMKTARSWFSLLSYFGKIYAVGGLDNKISVLNTVEVYNLEKDEWKQGSPINHLNNHFTGTSVLPV